LEIKKHLPEGKYQCKFIKGEKEDQIVEPNEVTDTL
jgi:hypothetical protein